MATEQWKQEHVEEMRAYRRKHYYENKEQYLKCVKQRRRDLKAFITALKKTLKCSRCPEGDFRCLDFHHVNPCEKEIAISQIYRLGWSKERLISEVEKCIVLYSNCHRKEHRPMV
jgi:hypothetical protein